MADVSIFLAFLFGIISFLSPCIIPMIIVYLTAITGFSVEELAKLKERKNLSRHVFFSTLVFVFAFTIVFVLLGGTAGFIGQAFSKYIAQYGRLMEFVGGAIFLLFGLKVLGFFKKIRIPILAGLFENSRKEFEGKYLSNGETAGFGKIFMIGFLFAVFCSHCFGYTFYPLLATTAASASIAVGMQNLLAFSMGLAIPFILAGIFFEKALDYLGFFKKHQGKISLAVGLILIIYGLILLTGNFLAMQGLFMQYFPDVLKLVK